MHLASFDFEKAQKVQNRVFAVVISMHLLLIMCLAPHLDTKIMPKKLTKLLVHTYSMQQKTVMKNDPQKEAPAKEAPAAIEIKPEECSAPQKTADPLEEAPAAIKAIPEEFSAPQKTDDSTNEVLAKEVPAVIKVKPKESPTPQKTIVKKIVKKEPPKLPQQKVQQKEKPTPKIQKNTPIAKTSVKTSVKTNAKTNVKTNAKPLVKKETPKPNKGEKERLAKQNACILDALSSLNKVEKITGNNVQSSTYQSTPSAHKIQSLASESLVAISQDTPQSHEEKTYYDELVHRLKLHLKLPDNGDVRLKLTINRSGKCVRVECLETKSKKNLEYLKKMLPTLVFPAFGQNFSNEQTHTFLLHFSRDFS